MGCEVLASEAGGCLALCDLPTWSQEPVPGRGRVMWGLGLPALRPRPGQGGLQAAMKTRAGPLGP